MSATSLKLPLARRKADVFRGDLALIKSEIRRRSEDLKQAISLSAVEGEPNRFRLAGQDAAFEPVEIGSFNEAVAFLRGVEFGENHAWTACAIQRQGAAWRVLEGVEALRGEDFAVFASERFANLFAEGMGHGAWLSPAVEADP